MTQQTPSEWLIQIALADADSEQLDQAARLLLAELRDQPVASAELLSSGPAPSGSKGAEGFTIGAILFTAVPAMLPKLVEFLQAWCLRDAGRSIKFKGKVGGNEIEFEGRADDLKSLLAVINSQSANNNPPDSGAAPAADSKAQPA